MMPLEVRVLSPRPGRMVKWFSRRSDIPEFKVRFLVRLPQAIKLPKVIRLKTYVKLISNLTTVRYSRRNILLRDDHTCQYCGKHVTGKDAMMDHVVPKSRGGKSTWNNVVTACHRCNNKKDNRTPKEAGMTLMSQPRRPKIANLLKEKLFEEFGLV